eukprot:3414568-Amphidinium_carterae.1
MTTVIIRFFVDSSEGATCCEDSSKNWSFASLLPYTLTANLAARLSTQACHKTCSNSGGTRPARRAMLSVRSL